MVSDESESRELSILLGCNCCLIYGTHNYLDASANESMEHFSSLINYNHYLPLRKFITLFYEYIQLAVRNTKL